MDLCFHTSILSNKQITKKLGMHLDRFETVGVTSHFNHNLKCRLVLPKRQWLKQFLPLLTLSRVAAVIQSTSKIL